MRAIVWVVGAIAICPAACSRRGVLVATGSDASSGGAGGRASTDGGVAGARDGSRAGAGGGDAAGAGGGDGPTGCAAIAAMLDGFTYAIPCGPNNDFSALTCSDPNLGVCPGGSEYLLEGHRGVDLKVTAPGPPSLACSVTLRVRGIVEPKHYVRCTTYFGRPEEGWASGPAAGGAASGCYPSTLGNYNVYMLQVGTDSAGQRYYPNALNQSEAHFTFPIDYAAPPLVVHGGDELWFLADDSNCSMIRNCDSSSVDNGMPAGCHPSIVPDLSPDAGIIQPYDGQFIRFDVVDATEL
jgi:hypothetical protein